MKEKEEKEEEEEEAVYVGGRGLKGAEGGDEGVAQSGKGGGNCYRRRVRNLRGKVDSEC